MFLILLSILSCGNPNEVRRSSSGSSFNGDSNDGMIEIGSTTFDSRLNEALAEYDISADILEDSKLLNLLEELCNASCDELKINLRTENIIKIIEICSKKNKDLISKLLDRLPEIDLASKVDEKSYFINNLSKLLLRQKIDKSLFKLVLEKGQLIDLTIKNIGNSSLIYHILVVLVSSYRRKKELVMDTLRLIFNRADREKLIHVDERNEDDVELLISIIHLTFNKVDSDDLKEILILVLDMSVEFRLLNKHKSGRTLLREIIASINYVADSSDNTLKREILNIILTKAEEDTLEFTDFIDDADFSYCRDDLETFNSTPRKKNTSMKITPLRITPIQNTPKKGSLVGAKTSTTPFRSTPLRNSELN